MKKILFILISVLIISCSNDDDSGNNHRLKGDWFLTRADCFCGFDPSIDFSDFTLRFDNSRMVVHINNPAEGNSFIAEPGSYNYTLDDTTIKINGAEPFKYELTGSTLILTKMDHPEIADDELVLTYKKQE